MTRKRIFLASAFILFGQPCMAQQNAPADDWKPASSNQPGKEFPQVNSEGRVKFRIVAPQAQSVTVSFRDSSPFTKGEDGAWVGYTRPLDEGFHYYTINIDGAEVPDPNSMFFFGANRWGSGVELPAHDQDFYDVKDVPHGQLREILFYSKSTGSSRRAFVYTPPGYDEDPNQRYPVLYLQHGWGENEYSWGVQGRANLIMDNLIAEGKTKPFIIVMTYGMTNEIRFGGLRNFDIGPFQRVLVDELIPYIDTHFRTLSDQPNRAMAGLSMGGMETKLITLKNLDKFSHIGLFSGGTISLDDVNNTPGFQEKVKLVFVSYGSKEVGGDGRRRGVDPQANADALKQAGINSHYYVSPETAHEWQSWRRSLREIAPLLFADSAGVAKPAPSDSTAVSRPASTQSADRPQGRRTGPGRGRGGFGGPIELGPNDKPAFADPPAGFNVVRDDISHGKLEMIQYDSKTVGTRRNMLVYTPPGYTADEKYPVLYLLHGIGGDETEWQRACRPEVILDNLIADGRAVPMIVVMPNGRAQKNDRAEGNVFESAPAFATFERDLLDDVIPAVGARYSVLAHRQHRALAGLSMGGGQSLNFGLTHLDTFAWVGGFSSAPNTKPADELVPDPAAARERLKLLWLSCGNKDGLIRISQRVHAYLKEHDVPHVWHVDSHGHDGAAWSSSLYHFAQHLFKRPIASQTTAQLPATGPGAIESSFTSPMIGPFKWTSSGVLIKPLSDETHQIVSMKDPTVVYYNNMWHVYATTANTRGNWSMVYLSFKDWSEAANAKLYYIDQNPGLRGYHCAPQVFYFRPHKKWYLIYQSQHPQYSTTDDLSKPEMWTEPENFFASRPSGMPRLPIDYWVICDDTHAYLFFTGDDGRLYRSRTKIEDFPNGMSDPETILEETRETLFEASMTYKIKGTNTYLTLVEGLGPSRYYRAYTSNRLDGKWTPVSNAETYENPFAGINNVAFEEGIEPWTMDISHGELIRDGYDETLTIDWNNLQMLYQGRDPASRGAYHSLPYQLGVLKLDKSAK